MAPALKQVGAARLWENKSSPEDTELVTNKFDLKLEKWKKRRPFKNLSEKELAELVSDLREETTAIEVERKAVQSERRFRVKRRKA